MAHTPGPWEIEPKERRENPLFVMDKEGDRIARCDGLNMADFGPTPEQAKANARLIAAAPEMLECLKSINEFFRHHNPVFPTAMDDGERTFKEVVADAIVKAEGSCANAN